MRFVCIDVDGVLLDMLSALESYLKTKKLTFIPQNVTRYNFKCDIGCNREEIYKSFREIGLYKYLEPFSGALESVYKLQRNSIRTDAYSSVCDNINIRMHRRDFCDNLGLEGNVYIGKKPPILEADALFDDCLDVHRDWIEAGYKGKLYLINSYYNQEYYNTDFPYFDYVIRCKDFKEAVNKYLEGVDKSV